MSKPGNVQPYGGYYARLSLEENVELTHVERGTPGGEYLRRISGILSQFHPSSTTRQSSFGFWARISSSSETNAKD